MPDYDDSRLLGWLSMQPPFSMGDEDAPVGWPVILHCEIAGWITSRRLPDGRCVYDVTARGFMAINESPTALIVQREQREMVS